jgi:hypothetical protein
MGLESFTVGGRLVPVARPLHSVVSVIKSTDPKKGDAVQKRKINAKQVVADIRSGMGDTMLMEKYDLSTKQLEGVLRKLLALDLITDMQLYERTSLSDTQITKAFVESENAIRELD